MAMLSMAPSERCGDGIVAGREGICWSVVSNGLRCQRPSEDASIPGVACRTLIDNIPVHPVHRQEATPNRRRQAPQRCPCLALRCDCCLPVGDAPAKGIALVLRRRFGVLNVIIDNTMAALSDLLHSPSLLPRSSRRSCLALFASRRIGKEATTPARRSFREMRLT